ncbi:hypothetical protein NBRC3299_0462 [Acetobacter pasteurianus NBRC 3299]|nr:hypothetical protein NBRC3299_0462 [Acetobacter pasteurianus NBRC 3299]
MTFPHANRQEGFHPTILVTFSLNFAVAKICPWRGSGARRRQRFDTPPPVLTCFSSKMAVFCRFLPIFSGSSYDLGLFWPNDATGKAFSGCWGRAAWTDFPARFRCDRRSICHAAFCIQARSRLDEAPSVGREPFPMPHRNRAGAMCRAAYRTPSGVALLACASAAGKLEI